MNRMQPENINIKNSYLDLSSMEKTPVSECQNFFCKHTGIEVQLNWFNGHRDWAGGRLAFKIR